ncbi:phage antirepressor KilAC domain-containing protein, partial [Mobiluncus mulieris]|uniref:phage antirepressor KilAC domain-containing protein n=1 Tax=Mobiluncus mulieris TaxID=2052 RepID=UPI0021E31C75
KQLITEKLTTQLTRRALHRHSGLIISSTHRHNQHPFNSTNLHNLFDTLLLENDELLEQALTRLRAERVKRLAAEQALLEAAPKVSYYDIVLQSPSLMPITAIAKDYGLSAKKLNRLLADEHIQFKQSGIWYLYAEYAKCGHTQSKTHLLESGKTVMHTYWTQKGRLFIYDLLKNRCHILPVIERQAGESK